MTAILARACHTAGRNLAPGDGIDGNGGKHCASWWKPTSPTTPITDPDGVRRILRIGPGGWSTTYFALDWRWIGPWPNDGTTIDPPYFNHGSGFWLNWHNYSRDNGNFGGGGIGWGWGNVASSVAVTISPLANWIALHIENNSPTWQPQIVMPPAGQWQSLMIEITWGRKSGDQYLNTLAGGVVGKARVWQDGTLTLDSTNAFPGGLNTLQAAVYPGNGVAYIQAYADFWQGSIYASSGWDIAADGVIEQTAVRIGQTAADCLGDTSIVANTSEDFLTTYDPTQGTASPNGHGGNSWMTTPATGTRTIEQFIVPAEFQGGVSSPPANTALPTVSGTLSEGSTLTATTGTWSNSPTGYSYQWRSTSNQVLYTAIGADSSTYTLTDAEVGLLVDCVVTASNSAGAGLPATSALTTIVDDGAGNFIGNGTMEASVDGWAGNQGTETVAQSTDEFNTGSASLEVTTPGDVVREGVYWAFQRGINRPVGSERTSTVAVMVPTGNSILVGLNSFDNTGARVQQTPVTVTGDTGVWQTVTVTDTAPAGSADCQISITTGDTAQAVTFYVDDATMTVAAPSTPVFDAASTAKTSGVSTVSWSHTCTGTDLVLYVGVSFDSHTNTVSSVKFNAVDATLVKREVNASSGTCELWRLIAPATGSHTVAVTLSGADAIVAGAISLKNANQTTPERAAATAATGSTAAATVAVTSDPADVVVAVANFDTDSGMTLTTTTGTERWNSKQFTTFGVVGAGLTMDGAASVSPKWTQNVLKPWSIIGVSVKAAVPVTPSNTAVPAVSGTATNGETLSATTGTWNNDPTGYGYQWQRDTAGDGTFVNITGAKARLAAYKLQDADVGNKVRCAVTAINTAGSATADSAATALVADATPVNTAPPEITVPVINDNSPVYVGATLMPNTGTWTFRPASYSYQWQRADDRAFTTNVTDISTDTEYTVTTDDVDKYLRVTVTATNTAGDASADSNIAGAILARIFELVGVVPI